MYVHVCIQHLIQGPYHATMFNIEAYKSTDKTLLQKKKANEK